MSSKLSFLLRWMAILAVPVMVTVIARVTPAGVTPLTLIERQLIKPNMLIVFDTSTSMSSAPGANDINYSEVGVDCDNGDEACRDWGYTGRCFFSSGGAMGAGVSGGVNKGDLTKCHNDTECQVGFCMKNLPEHCSRDTDCDSGGYCKGWCSHSNSTACNRDSDCGTGNYCRGICSTPSSNLTKPRCTSDADCAPGDNCSTIANDFCATSTTGVSRIKMCKLGMNRCRSDADCTAYTGDICGPATSRMVIAKRVIAGVVSAYYTRVNFGLMTFRQSGYYPYYPVSGSITNSTITTYLDRDMLKSAGCWTKNDGPASTCTLNGQSYNRRNNPDSKYRVKIDKDNYTVVDNNWCGLWCTLPSSQGTGYYQGSFYTYTDPQASLSSTTPNVQASYQGKTLTIGGVPHVYWDPPNTLRNTNGVFNANQPPEDISSGGTLLPECCANCGGRADTMVAPFMLDTSNDPTKAHTMAMAIIAKMQKAAHGGLFADGGTPTGCTLSFDNTTNATDFNNARTYMTKVKSTDTLPCRNNYVLLMTDGIPTAANEVACDSAACAAADPKAAGCQCRTVLATQELLAAGIKTYVVGFSGALSSAYGRATLNNAAKAGGTNTAFFAVQESELRNAITDAIYDAAKGSYSTAPAAAASGAQQASGAIIQSKTLLDTRLDFPGWKGQLIAYDTATSPPAVLWNAATVAFDYNVTTGKYFTTTTPVDRTGEWKQRNVWTSSDTTMVKILVDQTTGAITNRSTLKSLGIGATDEEAEKVARWMLGDPAMGNPAVLGAILNSTPIDVGPAGQSELPGGNAFYEAQKDRPYLTYVGASDGMLHAFYTKDITAFNVKAGQEAFAYIPQTMVPVILKQYAQNGQLPDPKDHVYGLANSPKVKNLCTANCTDAATAVWKTHLIMTYGWGGTEAFMIDVTSPFTSSGIKSSSTTPPAPLIWSTQYMNNSTTSAYDNTLGLTTSVPAFYYAKTGTKDDFRIVFGSYGTDASTGQIAKVLLNSSARNGAIVDSKTINASNSCTQVFGLMSDVATARNHAVTEETQIAAAYFGDTWGNLYRYVPNIGTGMTTGTSGTVSTVESMTCNHPVHYAPTIVQLDREDPTKRPGEIYIVQVSNSALDPATSAFPASKIVFRRDLLNQGTGAITADTTFGTGGKIELTAGVSGQMCGETSADGTTCVVTLPAGARPNATPMGILRADGDGFQVLATWYLPAVDGCNDGSTYLTLHEFRPSTGAISQKFAMKLASEPVTSAVFVGGKLLFARQGAITDLTGFLPSGTKFGGLTPSERFRRTGWTERP